MVDGEEFSSIASRMKHVRQRLGFKSAASFARAADLVEGSYRMWELPEKASPGALALKRALLAIKGPTGAPIHGRAGVMDWIIDPEGAEPPSWVFNEEESPFEVPPELPEGGGPPRPTIAMPHAVLEAARALEAHQRALSALAGVSSNLFPVQKARVELEETDKDAKRALETFRVLSAQASVMPKSAALAQSEGEATGRDKGDSNTGSFRTVA